MDLGTCFKNCVGGEVRNLSQLTARIRDDLIQEAKQECRQVGANAIVGVRFETNTVFEGTLDVLFYGTAVQIQY